MDSAGLARLSVRLTPMVARRVERIRGLRFKTLPRPRVISAAGFRRLTLHEAGGGRAQRRLVAAGTVETKMLGLLSPDADTSSLTGDTSELAAAAYDTKTKRLYIIRDAVPQNRDLTEFVLAHELTHALEDQNFGLAETGSSSDDGALARLALTEGTATAVMTEYARRYLDPLALAGSAAGLDTSTHGVPDFIVEQLSFAYLRGASFVQALYGILDNWKLVNLAITRLPPVSSRQIIHPGDYLHYQRPVPVRITGSPGPAFRRIDAGAVGEFTTGQLLRLGVSGAVSREAADGWAGDRYVFWQRRGVRTRCDSTASCRANRVLSIRWHLQDRRRTAPFTAALRGYLQDGLGGTASAGDSSPAGTWRLPGGGWAAIGRGPESVTLVLAGRENTARRLAG